jgi:hypothetical protein
MYPRRLAPPLGFHLVTFVGAALTASWCGPLTFLAWLVATLWLLGLLATTPNAPSNNASSKRTHHTRHCKGKSR